MVCRFRPFIILNYICCKLYWMVNQSGKKHFVFDWTGAFALIGGMIGGTMLVSALNMLSIFIFNTNFQYKDYYLIIANAAGFLGAILAFDYLVARPQTGRKLNFSMGTSNVGTYMLIFPMMFGMMLIAEFITGNIPITGPFFGEYYNFFSKALEQMTKNKATLIVLAVVMAPLFEEIVFRGIIQKGLITKGVMPFKAILFSSLIFGIVHGNPWQFVGAVMLGCVLGLVYYKTKSLLLPIILHAFNNLCSALLIFYADTESFADTFQVSEWLLLGVGIVLFGVFYYLFIRKYRVLSLESDY